MFDGQAGREPPPAPPEKHLSRGCPLTTARARGAPTRPDRPAPRPPGRPTGPFQVGPVPRLARMGHRGGGPMLGNAGLRHRPAEPAFTLISLRGYPVCVHSFLRKSFTASCPHPNRPIIAMELVFSYHKLLRCFFYCSF